MVRRIRGRERAGIFFRKDFRGKPPSILIRWRDVDDLVVRHLAGESLAELAKENNIRPKALFGAFRHHGLRSPAERKKLNLRALRRRSSAQAYWLGFLMADGYVQLGPNNFRLSLGLSSKDRGQLEAFRRFLGSTHAISENKRKTSTAVALCIPSRAAAELVQSLGIECRKTNRENAPVILRFNPHFWRGVVDGDGTVHLGKRGKPTVVLCGGKTLMHQFSRFVVQRVGGPFPKVATRSGTNYVSFSGTRAVNILDVLYNQGGPSLERKRTMALFLLSRPLPRIRRNRSEAVKEMARRLSGNGLAFTEIQEQLELPQSTLQRWLSGRPRSSQVSSQNRLS